MRLEHDTPTAEPFRDTYSRPSGVPDTAFVPRQVPFEAPQDGVTTPAFGQEFGFRTLWPDRSSLVRLAITGLLIAIAAAVLIGWALDIEGLKAPLPGTTTMKANTALGLGAAGIAMVLFGTRTRTSRAIAAVAALVILSLGALSLLEYAASISLGIDELLVLDPDTTSQPFNGRMSPATAIGFVAGGAGLILLILGKSRRSVVAAHVLAIIPGAIGLLSLLGYAYGVDRRYHFGPFVAVALHTAVGLELLAAGILLERMDEGWAHRLVDRPIARAVLLRVMLLSLVLPFMTGLLVVHGIRAGLYEAEVAPALFAVAATAALAWVAFRAGTILSVAEGEIRSARAEANERKNQLERSQDRHSALIEALPQLVWTCLPDGRCNYLSPQWLAYTGKPHSEQLGFGWLLATHPDDLARSRAHWLGTVSGRHEYDIDTRLRRADGTYRWFKTHATPIRRADDTISYWFATCTDIEDIVEARDVLARSRKQLEAEVEARSVEMMALEAQLRQSQKMEAVGQLTGGLAHDFNNLLTGISGSLELLQKRVGQGRVDQLERYIGTAREASQRAVALTQRLLAFSRRQSLDPVATDINRLASGMEELIHRTVGPSIALEVVGAAGLWTTMVDQAQLEGALLNLCINGRDAMPHGGRLTIETANKWLDSRVALERDLPEGEYVLLCVSDTGAGMTTEIQQRAFEPFFTTKPLGGGTGLGLSMVYGFVRQSGGQVRIHSEIGQGTTMRIYLPRYHGEPQALQTPAPSGALAAARGSETILVIDDEPTVRLLICEVLSEAGFAVIEASDGAAGLKIVQSGVRIDLLITDVGLPGGINGRQVADAARSLRPELKILFVTGYADNVAVSHGQLEPGMAILTKPFEMNDLHRRLQDLL